MKRLASPEENLTKLFTYIIKAYNKNPKETEGTIQFNIHREEETHNYYLKVDRNQMNVEKGMTPNPTTTLTASLLDWLDLAAGRLNPIMGVIKRKLQFKGDTAFFSKVMKTDTPDIDLNEYQDPVTSFETDPVKHWKKPEYILIVNGSPRKNQGYTQFYLNPFIEGMRNTGVEVKLIQLGDYQIKSCTGCWSCWMSGTGKCVIKDDMEIIRKKINACDMLVVAFPLYVDGTPALVKQLIERLVPENHPFMIPGVYKTRHPRRDKKDRSLVLFSICGFPEMTQFSAVRDHFKAWSHNSHMPLVAEVLRPKCMNLFNNPLLYGSLLTVLDALRDGGRQVTSSGTIASKTLNMISQSSGSINEFRKGANEFWFELIQRGHGPY